LRIVSESVPFVRSLALGVWINVGSRDETPPLNGMSHFIEHAVFKGTSSRKTHHIAQYLESVGGYINAFTTKDSTCYYARVLSQHLERAVTILSDIVQHPSFLIKEIEKEKLVILEEMSSTEDDPEDLIHDYFEKNVFGAHPLGQPILGKEKNILSFDQALLNSFVKDEYTASHLLVAASGGVDHEALVRSCERAFSGLEPGKPRKRSVPRQRKPRNECFTKPTQQTHFVIGKQVPGSNSEERYPLSLLNTILGDGMSSRLFQNIREKYGYAYNIYSFLSLFEDVGAFGIYVAAKNGSTETCRQLLHEELENLRTKAVSRRELHRAMEQVIGGMLLGLESMSARMNRIGKELLVFENVISVDEMISHLRACSPEDILRTAQYACDDAAYFSTTIDPEE
jgi:predicted Zn-dependent peptidase